MSAALIWVRSPKLFLGVAYLYGMMDRKSSPLEPALRSLVTVRVPEINRCQFCVDLNSATFLKRGAGMVKVEALDDWRKSGLFDEREQVALDYAEAVTRSDSKSRIGTWTHFDDDAIVELIAFQNMSSKFDSALGIPAQGFCFLLAGKGNADKRMKLNGS